MFEQIQISDVDVRVGLDRIHLEQPTPEPEPQQTVVLLNFSDELLRRMTDMEVAQAELMRRIEVLESRTLWDYVRSAWARLIDRWLR